MTNSTRRVNDAATKALEALLKGTVGKGCQPVDAIIACESTIVGLVLAVSRPGGDEIVVDTIFEGVKARLAEVRLNGVKPAGHA